MVTSQSQQQLPPLTAPSLQQELRPLPNMEPAVEFPWHYSDAPNRDFQDNVRSFIVVIVAFSVLLLLTVIFLCARWACRQRRLVVTVSSGDYGSAENGHATDVGGLKKEVIDGFPVVLHSVPVSGEEVQCSICLSVFDEGEKVKVLPGCEHGFHPSCVDKWLRGRRSCPLCRAVVGESPAVDKLAIVVQV